MTADAAIDRASIEATRPREGVAMLRIVSKPLGVLRLGVKRALRAEIAALEKDAGVRCVVLTGSERAFSVGSDIREFSQDPAWLSEAEREEIGLNAAIEAARFPVIAACNGHALGGGLVLALACDIRIAAASATFGVPEAKVAAIASGSGTQRLVRQVGRGRALHLLLTGRIVEAGEALALGLVEEVVPDGELLARALALAAEIAALPAALVAATKRCVDAGLREGWAAGLALETELAVELGQTEDAVEGQRAFIEKRAPRFNR